MLLRNALEAAGVLVSLYTMKGGGHGQCDDSNADEWTRTFFNSHLKPAAH
jgi:hypothetical protein